MLSNHCTAVIQYREKQQRIWENKKYNSGSIPIVYNRKKYAGQSITLEERKQNERGGENKT